MTSKPSNSGGQESARRALLDGETTRDPQRRVWLEHSESLCLLTATEASNGNLGIQHGLSYLKLGTSHSFGSGAGLLTAACHSPSFFAFSSFILTRPQSWTVVCLCCLHDRHASLALAAAHILHPSRTSVHTASFVTSQTHTQHEIRSEPSEEPGPRMGILVHRLQDSEENDQVRTLRNRSRRRSRFSRYSRRPAAHAGMTTITPSRLLLHPGTPARERRYLLQPQVWRVLA